MRYRSHHSFTLCLALGFLFTASMMRGSEWPDFNGQYEQGPHDHPGMPPHRGPMGGPMYGGPSGRWWSDPGLARDLDLTTDQQKKMDDVFDQSRLKLIDLTAGLQKAEAILEPLLSADRPDEARVLSQIDRIAQARADLEKANARMLLGLRNVLTLDQWKRLQIRSRFSRGPEH